MLFGPDKAGLLVGESSDTLPSVGLCILILFAQRAVGFNKTQP